MKIRLAAAVLLLAGASARAGQVNTFETTVDMAAGVAYGSLVDTRRSPDFVQYIGCDVSLRGNSNARVTCFAKSTTVGPLSCSSTRPDFVAIGSALSDQGYVRFECAGGELTYL